jgi:hypothetical protein
MSAASADRMNSEYISDFVEFCACREIDPETFLEVLNAQDWAAAKADSVQSPSDKRFVFGPDLEDYVRKLRASGSEAQKRKEMHGGSKLLQFRAAEGH